MAFDNRFFTVAGVTNIANLGESYLKVAINEMVGSDNIDMLIPGVVKKLEETQNKILEQRDEVLAKLKANNENEIRKRVNIFYTESGINHFTGINLADLVEGYMQARDSKIKNRYDFIYDFFNQRVPGVISFCVTDKEVQNKIIETFGGLFNHAISSGAGKTRKNGSVYMTSSTKFLRYDENGVLHVLAGKLSKAQERNVDDFIKKYKNQFNNLQGSTKIVRNVFVESGLRWGDTTQAKTKTMAKEQISNQELGLINRDMIKLILGFVSPKYHKATKGLLHYMLNKDPYMFFVGKATTQITGLLGEVGTLFAIDQLLGGNSFDKYVHWVAEEKNNGKQLSIDVIFELEGIPIGVQSKNSILPPDLKEEFPVSFASGPAETIFTKLFGFAPDGLIDVLASNTFNVPYRKEGKHFVQVPRDFVFEENPLPQNFDEYVKQDERMERLSTDICLYLTQFAPNFLYMSSVTGYNSNFSNLLATLDKSLFNLKGNFMFMVGTRVEFANEILKRIQDNLQAIQEIRLAGKESENKIKKLFNLEVGFNKFKDDEENIGLNIVEYYNKKIGSNRSLKNYYPIVQSSAVL